MEILEAFCQELGRAIDIYEAQQTFFAAAPGSRKRLNFRCSDNLCRGALTPLIVAVNYDKHADETEKYRQPYFKSHDKHPHLPSCTWVLNSSKRVASLEGVDDAHEPRISSAKVTDVIDVFNPKTFDTPARRAETIGQSARDDATSIKEDAAVHEKSRAREGYSSTTRLERFINCWSSTEQEDRKSQHVVIDGQTLTYRQAVLHVKYITHEESGSRVVHGGVRVKLWPEGKPTRIYLNFMDECSRLGENQGSRALTIDLPIKRVNEYLGGALMMERIQQASTSKSYLKAYAWGRIEARDGDKPGYQVELDSLDNLVLKVTPRKSAA